MGAAHLAAPHVNRRCDHLSGSDLLHQQADRRHISHRIHRSHLVEMYLRHRNAVCVTLRLGDQPIDRKNIRLYLVRYRKVMNNMLNLMHTAMVVMLMRVNMVVMLMACNSILGHRIVVFVMIVFIVMLMVTVMVMVFVSVSGNMAMCLRMFVHGLIFLHAVHLHCDMRTANAAFTHLFLLHHNARDLKRIQLRHKSLRIRKQLQQRCRQHIPRRSHAAVQI